MFLLLKLFSLIRIAGLELHRNAGIRASTSDYIAFCDADDYWDTNHLLNAAEILTDDPRQFDILGSTVNFSSGKSSYLVSEYSFLIDHTSLQRLLIKNIMVTSTLIVKKTLFNGLWFSNLRNRQDLELICNALTAGKAALWHPNKTVFYDDERRGISSNKLKMMRYNFIVYQKFTRSIVVSILLLMRWAFFNKFGF